MKRLLIDANPVVPYYVGEPISGIGRTTLELINALGYIPQERFSFDVHLWSQNMKGVGAKSLDVPFKKHHAWIPNRAAYQKWATRFRLREIMTRYDLMHITHNYEQVADPSRVLVTIHDALFMHIEEKRFGHAEMRRIMPSFARSCRHIVTCSEYSKQDIVETMGVSPDKVSVVYWGMNHDIFHPLDKDTVHNGLKELGIDYPYFFGVSCNTERKRTPALIEAFLKNWREGAKNHLVLAWASVPDWVRKSTAAHPAGKYIHFLGRVSDEQLTILYNGATASINPSQFEGFGLPLIEAMACGCPVVASNNTSHIEIGTDAAIMLDEPIESSLESVLYALECGSVDTSLLVEAGYKRASQFRWSTAANQMLEIYSNLLS